MKKTKIGIVGLGYVGLPLGVLFAKQGFFVAGIDTDADKCAKLNRGQSYILDVPSKELKAVVQKGRFKAYADYRHAPDLDAVIICVPTPLNKVKEPDITFVVKATEQIAARLKKGQLVVLESTTYPGTTEEIVLPKLQKSGLKVEEDFFLAFSPERVDPGNPHFSTENIPKVVGGVGPKSTKAAAELYGSVMKKIVPVSSAKTAEMAKLLENTFRSVNIGLINEMALMSYELKVDIWEVVEAAKTKPFGFMPFYPGPGIGGHCLPIDPLYLSWKSREHGFEAKMIELAAHLNSQMPLHVVKRVGDMLNERGKALKKASVLVLGASYKRDIDDFRESPSLDVMDHLAEQGCKVSYCDPYVPQVQTKRVKLKSQKLTPALLKRQQCVIILTDHRVFDWNTVVKYSKLILDTRNALRRFKPRANLFFL